MKRVIREEIQRERYGLVLSLLESSNCNDLLYMLWQTDEKPDNLSALSNYDFIGEIDVTAWRALSHQLHYQQTSGEIAGCLTFIASCLMLFIVVVFYMLSGTVTGFFLGFVGFFVTIPWLIFSTYWIFDNHKTRRNYSTKKQKQ